MIVIIPDNFYESDIIEQKVITELDIMLMSKGSTKINSIGTSPNNEFLTNKISNLMNINECIDKLFRGF